MSIFYNYITGVERNEEVENINDQNHGNGYREQGLLLNVIILISIDMFIIINSLSILLFVNKLHIRNVINILLISQHNICYNFNIFFHNYYNTLYH